MQGVEATRTSQAQRQDQDQLRYRFGVHYIILPTKFRLICRYRHINVTYSRTKTILSHLVLLVSFSLNFNTLPLTHNTSAPPPTTPSLQTGQKAIKMSLSHITSCPGGQTQSTLGCGTTQCCDIMGSGSNSSGSGSTGGTCYPNIYGTCVCFDYNGPTGQNYTFVGICSDGGAVAGVPTVKSCSSAPASAGGKDSCYCRQTVPGDNSMVGNTQAGNWIFGPGGPGDCLVFNSTGASTSSAVASASATSTGVRSGAGRVRVGGLFGLALAVVLIRIVFSGGY